MKYYFSLLCLLCIVYTPSFAQPGDLQVQGVSPSLYLTHAVAAKENWYSIGRLYNISPKEIAPFNSMGLDHALAIGQSLKIPLTATNFSQDGSKAGDEVFVPLYHTVQEKEWMFRISTNYNKVPVENLEKWNSISKDQVKAGMNLVVGYLKVKPALSALASKGSAAIEAVKTVVTTTSAPVVTKPQTPIENKPAVPVVAEKKPAVENPVVKNDPPPAPVSVNKTTSVDYKGGYFKSMFENNDKNTQGTASIFRSNSGWQDGKYYALMNNVPIGTIVKINNPSNSKVVYAKVLGNLTDMKENNGLVIRISDAASAELGTGEGKFAVDVKY